MPESPPQSSTTRAGTVALVGRPNVGKSTLMNAFVGERLSIATHKAQTTWREVAGILSTESYQAVFLDTPGLIEPRDLHQTALARTSHQSASDADLVLIVVDAADASVRHPDPLVISVIEGAPGRRLAALNKIDQVSPERVTQLQATVREAYRTEPFAVSAAKGTGIDALLEEVGLQLPPGPFLFPADQIGAAPVRFFVSELVRETVFERFQDELPYSTLCAIEDFRESEEPCYIAAVLYVEKASQKGILIGSGGRAIRALGTAARKKIEHFMDRRVYLDLWVKVLPNWRKKRQSLARFGYHVPADAPHAKDG